MFLSQLRITSSQFFELLLQTFDASFLKRVLCYEAEREHEATKVATLSLASSRSTRAALHILSALVCSSSMRRSISAVSWSRARVVSARA